MNSAALSVQITKERICDSQITARVFRTVFVNLKIHKSYEHPTDLIRSQQLNSRNNYLGFHHANPFAAVRMTQHILKVMNENF